MDHELGPRLKSSGSSWLSVRHTPWWQTATGCQELRQLGAYW